MSFQVPGRVVKVNVQEGQSVTKNQIIAELDREEFESRYDQAKANLEQAKRTKQQLETDAGNRQENAPSEVTRAKAAVKSAQRYFKRC